MKGKQDGRVGLDATSSQENMKITITEHPSTKKTATYQKKTFYIQKQRINHNKEGHIHDMIKSHTFQVDDPLTRK